MTTPFHFRDDYYYYVALSGRNILNVHSAQGVAVGLLYFAQGVAVGLRYFALSGRGIHMIISHNARLIPDVHLSTPNTPGLLTLSLVMGHLLYSFANRFMPLPRL